MLTVCNNGRVAVTIEVEILAFPREGGRSSDPAKIFCGFDTVYNT